MKSTIILLMMAGLLISCSPDTDKKAEGVLTEAQKQTLEKAKQTEDVLKATDDKRVKELEEAEGK